MPILTRYVLFELIKVFLVALAGVTLLLLLVGVVKQAYLEGLGLKQILLLMPFILPDAARFSVPAAMLFAACNVFGRLSSANEVIAIKASGISPMVLFWPVIFLSFFLSLWAVWLNDVAVSWGADGATRVILDAVEEVAYGKLAQQHSYSAHQFSINVGDVEGKRLIRPTITLQGGGDAPPRTITCEEATMRSDHQANTLTMVCFNGTVEVGDFSFAFPDSREVVIPLDDSSHKPGGKSPSYLAMNVIPQETVDQRSRIQTLQQQLAANAACQLISGDFSGLQKYTWQGDARELNDAQQRLYRLNTEPPRRWANGFSCLCFVLVGAPLAIWMRNSDLLTSFFMCFLPILICYYPLLMFAVSKAKSGALPGWCVWGGNVILALVGAQFMRRVYQR
jgi:lipopolysaccharide export system permease protein